MPRKQRTSHRRPRQIIIAAVTAAAVIFAAGFPLYVDPQVDELRPADAIFVLGGHGYERYPYALELAESGLGERVLMSNPAGTKDIWLTDLCTHRRYQFEIDCFVPTPANTRGEARQLRELAAHNNWHTVIVVTTRPHISRARYILQRCFSGTLIMTDSPPDPSLEYWIWSYAYQTAGYVRAVLQSGC